VASRVPTPFNPVAARALPKSAFVGFDPITGQCPKGFERDTKGRCAPVGSQPLQATPRRAAAKPVVAMTRTVSFTPIPAPPIRVTPPPTGFPMLPTETMNEVSESFVHKRVIGALGGAITGGLPGAIGGFISGGQPGSTVDIAASSGALPFAPSSGCGPGFERDSSGRCARAGFVGTAQRLLPGGSTGFQPDGFGAAVNGAFGVALEPAAMAATRLRCPRGTVLGRDNLCYNRSSLRKSERKWSPGTKPVLTGGQVNTLRKAQRIQERMKKLGLIGGVPHTHRKKTRKLLR